MRRSSRRLKGIGASPGIAQGTVYVVDASLTVPPQYHIKPNELDAEVRRFEAAAALAVQQIRVIKDRLSGADGGEHLLILEAHLLMLNDTIFFDGIKNLIREEGLNAEWALRRTVDRIRSMFDGLADNYFSQRGSDIEFIGERILRNLLGKREIITDDDNLPPDAVVIARDLSPAHTAKLARFKVRAFITEGGSRTSHAAIVARSLDIPAVVGASGILQHAGTGDRVVVDGYAGEIILAPTKGELGAAKDSATRQRHREKDFIKAALTPATTADGQRVKVHGNIEMPAEAETVLSHGGEGIGLYRTEFLFVDRKTPPSEEEHLEQYRALVKIMGKRSMTIRTVDLGGDKIFGNAGRTNERNPALGLRAIRLGLQQPELLRSQLRAVLRLAAETEVRLLIPLVTQISEVRSVKEIIREVQALLRREGKAYAERIELGVMIETPASAVTADLLAREVDFFAIGTNDMIQYSLAIDRGNENVAYLYRPLHPAILRLLSQVVGAAHDAGIPVSVCGEMAAEMLYTPVLLGLGIREVSMNATAVPWVKKMIRDSDTTACRDLVDRLMMMASPLDIEEEVRNFIGERYPDVASDLY